MMRKKVLAKVGKIKLIFSPKDERWIMSGGTWGDHSIHSPGVYSERVKGHWEGYCKNNGVDVAPYPKRFQERRAQHD
ncbi:MAG: hypothetical protein M0R00_06700 [Candidatus Omnitrophica bacterium]|jgi:hypothetical protein|nr:hypothetical protein [Candidatus Omnitrophota bacterium]